MRDSKKINIGQFTDNYKVPSVVSKEDAWLLLKNKIEATQKPAAKKRTIKLNWTIASMAAAAAVVAFVVLFGLNEKEQYTPEIAANVAEIQPNWLPDSTTIQLNTNSTISNYYDKLTGERNVVVKGDALFEVIKGKKLTVLFDGGQVKVKGTAFYISAYSPDLLQVDCFAGSVEVTLDNQEFLLSKGKGVRMYKGRVTGPYACTENDIRDRLNGVFYWNRISLSEIADLIGYRFGYTTQIAPSLQNRNFSGKLDLNELQQGLTVISMAMNLEYHIDDDRKTITLDAE
jgi:transmembrane sensor